MSRNTFLTEDVLKHEIARAFHRSATTIAVHAYPADHPMGMKGHPSIHVGIPLRPRGRGIASWTRHPVPLNWQIMAMHEAKSTFLDAVIAELRERIDAH